MAVTLSDTIRHVRRQEQDRASRGVMRLNKELMAKNEEIPMLKKRLLLYKSLEK